MADTPQPAPGLPVVAPSFEEINRPLPLDILEPGAQALGLNQSSGDVAFTIGNSYRQGSVGKHLTDVTERQARTPWTVSAISTLVAVQLGILAGDTIVARGRAAPGDSGGGTFLVSASVQPADGGLVFDIGGGLRAFREGWTVFGFNGDVTPRTFGAVGSGAVLDTPALQAMLDSSAKRVLITPGVYLHKKLTCPNNRTIVGAGGTLKAAANEYIQIELPSSASNIAVGGVIFDGAGLVPDDTPETSAVGAACIYGNGGSYSGVSLSDNRFINIPITSQAYCAVQLSCDGGALITGNTVDQCGGDIINLNAGKDFVVTSNTLSNGGDGGIALNNGARGIVMGNTIKKCALGIGMGPEGTTDLPDYDAVVSGNRIDSCGHGILMGWFAFAGREAPNNVVVTGNILSNCKSATIRIDGRVPGSRGRLIVGANVVKDAGTNKYDGATGLGDGIIILDVDHVIAHANQVFDCAGKGIYLGGKYSSADLNIVKGCAGVSIQLAGDYSSAAHNIVTDGGSHGIQSAGDYVSVSFNIVKSCVGRGIYFSAGGAGSHCMHNTSNLNGVGLEFYDLALNYSVRQAGNTLVGNTTKAVNLFHATQVDNYFEFTVDGTTDGSGNLTFAHGLAAAGPYRIVLKDAAVKDSGIHKGMTFNYIDNSNVQFTSAVPGAPARAYIRVSAEAPAW